MRIGLKARLVSRAEDGQVVVEMALTLPFFFMIVFSIMEIGYLSFQQILLNHATYEVARIGGMTYAEHRGFTPNRDFDRYMKQIIRSASADCRAERNLPVPDPQSGQQNLDLVCTGSHNVQLIFPTSGLILSPRRDGKRMLRAVVRMPVETPLNR